MVLSTFIGKVLSTASKVLLNSIQVFTYSKKVSCTAGKVLSTASKFLTSYTASKVLLKSIQVFYVPQASCMYRGQGFVYRQLVCDYCKQGFTYLHPAFTYRKQDIMYHRQGFSYRKQVSDYKVLHTSVYVFSDVRYLLSPVPLSVCRVSSVVCL